MTRDIQKQNNRIRLNRYLAQAGIASRRKCDDLITAGRVRVNGKVVTELGVRIDPEKDRVEFDGREVVVPPYFIYLLMNKPPRVVTTVKDDRRRKTVLDFIPIPERLFPVGRLDFMTTGALLITNDGELAYYLTHPKFQVKKVYRVLLDKIIRPIDLHRFQEGVDLGDFVTSTCKAREIRRIDNRSLLEVELHEGKNRQIRRMFAALGYEVEELHRKEFAGLKVDDLREGEFRELYPGEVKRLKQLVKAQQEKILETVRNAPKTH